ncbi:MAG: polysaccharide biosynthesis tyrosine autokinase [Actinomycetota bacterium]|nr:polysaccharide biosynthesis tyrosine autokinase [Actinomycetota bacterium]MDQ5807960.1 polysaccharide biosynthesis tyrosine autokinase [Actinomycetota bacterium]
MDSRSHQEELGVVGLVRVLRRRVWLIVICIAVVAASAAAGSLRQQEQYTASASLLFRDPAFDRTLFGSSYFPATPDPAREAATNVELVSLNTVAARTADVLRTYTAAEISDKVVVEAKGQSDVVQTKATDPSPERAARIANVFAEQFIAFRREADRSKVREAQRLVDQQLRSLTPEERESENGESLRQRAEQLRILASLQTGNAELVQAASPPGSPSSPATNRNILMGGLLGLLVGVGLALLLDRLDRRISDITELEPLYGVPLVGAIPDSRALRSSPSAELSPHEAEAFRMLRTTLRYFNVDRSVRSLLVTSSAAQDGKTTVAWHLARTAAMSADTRVLIVETDLRRPTLASKYGLNPTPGLSELLTRDITLDDVLQHVPLAGNAQLDVITAGAWPPNPSELVESARMRAVLDQLKSIYDLVVVDTAPTSVVADGIPLMSQVNGVLIVTRVGSTTRDAAMTMRRQLEAVNAPVLGVIANRVKVRGSAYSYGYGGDYLAGSADHAAEAPAAPLPVK